MSPFALTRAYTRVHTQMGIMKWQLGNLINRLSSSTAGTRTSPSPTLTCIKLVGYFQDLPSYVPVKPYITDALAPAFASHERPRRPGERDVVIHIRCCGMTCGGIDGLPFVYYGNEVGWACWVIDWLGCLVGRQVGWGGLSSSLCLVVTSLQSDPSSPY